eukprot:TRINITY_DN12990_c0_g1_i1.p1 TRINITY_DN12990_c0_g1~~TRINITY_DN12990_c0_g1_i1.p1  ORF type:complete len:338 (+),score=58.27 TRINITY_DN12990_c0_g1_i1:59-1072(+)
MKTVFAIYNYTRRNKSELSLIRGEYYHVSEISANGSWLYGNSVEERQNKSGWFPVGYVEECTYQQIAEYLRYAEDLDEYVQFPRKCSFIEKGYGARGVVRVHVVRAELKKAKKVSAFIYRRQMNVAPEFLSKTKTLKSTKNPEWEEEHRVLSFDSEMEVIEILVSTEKKSKKVRSRAYGGCQISLRSCLRDFDAPKSKSRWISLLDENQIKVGSLLVNLQYKDITSISAVTRKRKKPWPVLSSKVFPNISDSSISGSVAEHSRSVSPSQSQTKFKIVHKVSDRAIAVTKSFKAVLSSSSIKNMLLCKTSFKKQYKDPHDTVRGLIEKSPIGFLEEIV